MTLKDQFISAISQWAKQTGEPEQQLVVELFNMASWQKIEGIDKPCVNADEARRIVEQLINKSGFTETFCVMAFVRAIEDRFRVSYEMHEINQKASERKPEEMSAIASDPTKFSEFREKLGNIRRRKIAKGIDPGPPVFSTPEELLKFADECEPLFQKDIVEDAESYLRAAIRLKSWQEVIQPIIAAENLAAAANYDNRL